MGVVLSDLGQLAEALAMKRNALAIMEKALGPEHPALTAQYSSMGTVLGNHGQHTVALPWMRKAAAINEIVLGPEHSELAIDYCNMSIIIISLRSESPTGIIESQGHLTEALALSQKAVAIAEKAFGSDHIMTSPRRKSRKLTKEF